MPYDKALEPPQPIFPSLPLCNDAAADRLDEVASLLLTQQASPARVHAYRDAAAALRRLERPVHELLKAEGLQALRTRYGPSGVPPCSIEQLALTGRLELLELLRGEAEPEEVLATIRGMGPRLAGRLHEELGIVTLVELEVAAYDGRLAHLPGFGPRRLRSVRETLARRLRRRLPVPGGNGAVRPPNDAPPVALLLDLDAAYRVSGSRLPRIAPRHHNPGSRAWLPVLHTDREGQYYTVLFSNAARAHTLGTTADWVVVYRDGPDAPGQWMVVTAHEGPLRGRRVVCGREDECAAYYRTEPAPAPA